MPDSVRCILCGARMDTLADYYARRAADYESIYARPERQADLEALRARIRTLLAGRRVLELACGTGYWTNVIAARASSVTALDVGEEVLEIARAKPNAGGVVFLRASAYDLPDFDRTHDALFAGFWWSHVPLERLDGFLGAAARAVAPGARVAFLDNRYVPGSSTPVSRRDAHGNSYQLRTLADGSRHEVLKNFPAEGELLRRAAGHGEEAALEMFEHYWLLTWRTPN
jgi:demethylmenaquinone methyltransferase/2-methoxy-6-polyprenyl-1,4-benzoquinol methylase